MAKITVDVDTETGLLSVDINGESQSNVQEVTFYKSDYNYNGKPELYSRITLSETNKETGITKTTYLIAKNSKEGLDAIASGAKLNNNCKDLVEVGGSDKFKSDVLNYFSL